MYGNEQPQGSSLLSGDAVPLVLMRWANADWVSDFPEDSDDSLPSLLLHGDPNQRISELGSRMLHLAAMSPHRPSAEVTKAVIEFLLTKRQADPNAADDYGRTPLSVFITSGCMSWRDEPEYGCAILELFFAHGADANVLFTPDFVGGAGCSKWTIAHHVIDKYHGRNALPLAMRQILNAHTDFSICDSAGRKPERLQLTLDI